MKAHSDKYFSKSLEKGLNILNLFTPDRNIISLKEIAQLARIDKTSAFRYVNTFVQLGYISKDPKTRLLKLGPKTVLCSNQFLMSFDLRQIVKSYLDMAYEEYNVTVDSALLQGQILVKLYSRNAKDTLAFTLPLVCPALHCSALGKAILAHLPPNEALALLDQLKFVPKTDKSLKNKDDLMTDLMKTKKRGYSLNNEEYVRGLISIGAPLIPQQTDGAIGAISFDFALAQSSSLKIVERTYSQIIIELAKQISKMIPFG